MTRKLYNEDGDEVEVPTDEELKELQTKAESVGKLDEFNQQIAEIRKILEVDEGGDLLEAIKAAKESTNPNWKEARQKIGRLETFIKANVKDAKFDDAGNVVSHSKEFTVDDVRKTTLEVLAKENLNKRLGQYPEDKREVIKHYFDKLSSGEELNAENIEKYVSEAERLVFPKGQPSTQVLDGKEPVLSPEGSKFVESSQGKEAANALFGEESFAAKKDNK